MKIRAFALRNTKEILRDKMNLVFGVGFPVILLLLLSLINRNIPAQAEMNLFALDLLTPGAAVFGLSFVALFAGMLISKDRAGSFMLRLFTSPMKASDFIIGYIIPLVPMCIVQIFICYLCAICLGLEITVTILPAIAVMIPASLLYIGIGLLCGTCLTDKQVGGICGALLTNLSAWLSGTWFSTEMVGGAFKTIADILPFSHAVDVGRAALAGNYSDILPDILWVSAYAIVINALAIVVFMRKMNKD